MLPKTLKRKFPKFRNNFIILSALIFTSCFSAKDFDSAPEAKFDNAGTLQIQPIPGQSTARELLIGKFSNDAYPDLVELTDGGAYFIKNEEGRFWSGSAAVMTGAGNAYDYGKALDVNGDGILDLVLHLDNTGIRIFTNSGEGTDAAFTPSSGFILARKAAAMDFAPMTATSGFLFVGSSNANHYYTALSNQIWSTTKADYVSPAFASGDAKKVLAADMNNDGHSDFVLFPATAGRGITIFAYDANSNNFSDAYTIQRSNADAIVDAKLIQMTGSSAVDILLLTSSGIELWKNDSSSTTFSFSLSNDLNSEHFSLSNATSFAVGDFTFTGTNDIFVTFADRRSELYQETAAKSLHYANVTEAAFNPDQLAAGASKSYAVDLDNDGLIDIVELVPNGRILVHLNEFNK